MWLSEVFDHKRAQNPIKLDELSGASDAEAKCAAESDDEKSDAAEKQRKPILKKSASEFKKAAEIEAKTMAEKALADSFAKIRNAK